MYSVVIVTHNRIDKLKDCIASISSQTTTPEEIIVINNNSSDGTAAYLNSFSKLITVHNPENIGLSLARNQGAELANNEWVLFVDDDNVLDQNCAAELLRTANKDAENTLGLSPIAYYYRKDSSYSEEDLWYTGAELNLTTSKARYYPQIQRKAAYHTQILHNVFMINRQLGIKVSWFDQKLFLVNTELDFILRAKASNPHLKTLMVPTAKTYHQIPKPDTIETEEDKLRMIVASKIRAFYLARNRAIIIRRHSSLISKVAFTFVFYPVFTGLYAALMVRHLRFEYLKYHLKGTVAGYAYLLFGRMIQA